MDVLSPVATAAAGALPCALPAPDARREWSASLQFYSNGLLLWQPETVQSLVLFADGTLGNIAAGALKALGEPLAPALPVRLRVQPGPAALLLWTTVTGPLRLWGRRWEIPLEATP